MSLCFHFRGYIVTFPYWRCNLLVPGSLCYRHSGKCTLSNSEEGKWKPLIFFPSGPPNFSQLWGNRPRGLHCDLGPPCSSFRSHHSLYPSTPSTHSALGHFRTSARALPYVWHLLRPDTHKVGPSSLPGLSRTPSPQRGLPHPNTLWHSMIPFPTLTSLFLPLPRPAWSPSSSLSAPCCCFSPWHFTQSTIFRVT